MALRRAYGPLQLTEQEWKRSLASDQGVFRRIATPLAQFKGPRLRPSGEVMGDFFSTETLAFDKGASIEQREFYVALTRNNALAAMEYLLTMTGAITIWKEDMVLLQHVVDDLENEERALRDEENILIGEGARFKNASRLLEALRRHLPEVFNDSDLDALDLGKLIQRIDEVLVRLSPRKNYLKEYLRIKRAEMPFLFG
mgnify:CR=1 FL=1